MYKSIFLQGHENMRFLTKARSNKDFNHYFYNQININSPIKVKILDLLFPFIYIANVLLTFVHIIYKFVHGLVKYRLFYKNKDKYDTIYLFFLNHFPDRCKAAGYYAESQFWILSPPQKQFRAMLKDKQIVDYKKHLVKCDSLIILANAMSTLLEYSINERSICLIHKIWEFYELKVALQKICTDSVLICSNQSDKYALMFDTLKCKKRILLQHGIVANWGNLPYRLKNIDIFYSMSNQTWMDAFNHLLECRPCLEIMKPTISLYDIPKDCFTVLIVAEMEFFHIEQNILQELSKENSIAVYLKKHPALIKDGSYRTLQSLYGFNYITEKKFPRVDFVISYYSTLAYEYMAYDIPVYMYMTKEEYSSKEMLKQLQNVKIEWESRKR